MVADVVDQVGNVEQDARADVKRRPGHVGPVETISAVAGRRGRHDRRPRSTEADGKTRSAGSCAGSRDRCATAAVARASERARVFLRDVQQVLLARQTSDAGGSNAKA